MRGATHIAIAAALALGAVAARAANPPSALDLPPNSNVIPAPVDIVPGAAPPRAPERPSEPNGNPLWSIPLSNLNATRERPLFSPSRRATPPAVAAPISAPPPPPPPSAPEQPTLVLVGAIVSETEGFAVFLDQASNSVVRLRVGQDHEGWVLRAVKGREATLEKNQQTTTLALPAPGETPAGQQPMLSTIPGMPGQKEPDL
jgi:general secretion pathway protein N